MFYGLRSRPDGYIFEFDREIIEGPGTSCVLFYLEQITKNRENIERIAGHVEFSITGYDGDPRQQFEIQKIRDFFEVINEHWPYWSYFVRPTSRWMTRLIAIICFKSRMPDQRLVLSSRGITEIWPLWLDSVSELADRFQLGDSLRIEARNRILEAYAAPGQAQERIDVLDEIARR